MKNFILFCLILFIFSCKKDEQLLNTIDEVNITTKGTASNYSHLVDLSSDVATFKTNEDYLNFMKILPTLSVAQKKELVNNVSYTTLNSYLESLYAAMDLIDDRQEFITFINQHSEYFEIIINESGEEEVVEKENTLDPILLIQNKDRIIKVENVYYKHISDICVKSSEYAALKSIKTKNDAVRSGLYYEIVIEVYNQGLSTRWGDFRKGQTLTAEKDLNWCKNDRRVAYFWIMADRLITIPIVNGDGTTTNFEVSQAFVFNSVRPTKKGIPCIWYNYKTEITMNNTNLRGELKLTLGENSTLFPFNYTFPNTTIETSFISDELLIIPSINEKAKVDARWIKQKTDVTTRGMDGLWIHLNQ